MNAEYAIATLGFRRWYERQLLESHAERYGNVARF